jgi:hypothetical protein
MEFLLVVHGFLRNGEKPGVLELFRRDSEQDSGPF